jgi:hypothetical protein
LLRRPRRLLRHKLQLQPPWRVQKPFNSVVPNSLFGLSNLSPEVGGKQIEAAVGEEITRRGWAPDTAKPGFVIVMGGFSGNEGPGDGSNRAKSLQPALRKSTPMLRAVEMRAIGSKAAAVNGAQQAIGGAGSYLLVVYLLYSGPQLEEDCTK